MPRISRREFLASSSVALTGAHATAFAGPRRERFSFFQPVDPPRTIQTISHRGMSTRAPENTRQAIEACVQDFVEWAEIDVRLTRDGKHVIFHDNQLDGKTNGHGPLAALALDELQKLDAGAWFAPRFKGQHLLSLAEILGLAKGKLNLYLDCKTADPERLVNEVRGATMENQVIVYGAPELVAAVQKASAGTVPVMTKYHPSMNFDAFLRTVAPHAVEIDSSDVTTELCQRFHTAGVMVQAKVLGTQWDNPGSWQKVIAAGVDWLQTDNPAAVISFAARTRLPNWPVMIALHRGANRYAPENTLPSILAAVALGADYIEIDIRTTRDGQFVLMHDASVDRTTSGKGRVNDLTLAQIRSFDAGSWFGKPFTGTRVPTLDEALAALGPRTAAYLDAKDIAPDALLAAVKNHGLLDRHVVYQSTAYAAKLKALDPRLRPLPPLRRATDLPSVSKLQPFGVDASWQALSKELIADCHKMNIKVFSDALGAHETIIDYRRAIAWGLDVIQTDHPLRVLRAVELEAQPA